MRFRPIGRTYLQASVVGFGAWTIGGWMWGGADDEEAVKAIQAAVDQGMNLIDTAPIYGFGKAEELVGRAIQDRRTKVVLATKCGMIWDEQKGEHAFNTDEKVVRSDGPTAVYKYLGPESIERELDASLKRLQTDHVDLYQTHWQEGTTAIEDTMACLEKLKNKGKVRAIGVCNAKTEQMDRYRKAGRLDSDQEHYSMLTRDREQDNLAYCRNHRMAFLAYSPLERGLLTGKITPGQEFSEGDQRRDHELFTAESIQRVNSMLEKLQPVADGHHVSIPQLVLAWTVHQPGCTHALAGARNVDQVNINATAADIDLAEDELKRINEAIEEYAGQPTG